MDRRDFIRGTLAGGGAVAVNEWAQSSAIAAGTASGSAAPDRQEMPYEVLGRTGVKVSRLGVGCAQFGQGRGLTVDDVAAVMHRALAQGINYFDTAPNYQDSEEKMGPTVKEIRDKIFLVSKSESGTYEGTWESIRRSLKRLQTDHLDMVHIHDFAWEERFGDLKMVLGDKGILGALREAKKQGVIRFIGASGHHGPSRFHALLDTGEVDVLMNAVNFVCQHTYDFENKVWSRAREAKVGLVAMKVLGGDGPKMERYKIPEEYYERAIRYALSAPGLSCLVIGMKNPAECERAARVVAGAQPLSDDERYALAREGLDLAGKPEWRLAYGPPLA